MFEIWGTLPNGKDDRRARLEQYMTKVLPPEDKNILFVPPAYALWKERLTQESFAVLTFRYFRYQNAPYVTLPQLKSALEMFQPVKDKILVSLSPMSTDFNLNKEISIPLTANQAILKSHIKSSPLFFDETIGASYFTYGESMPHLVWVEDTKSLAVKHNLIKSSGFRGIYWENPFALLDGNWESLYEIWQKRTSRLN